MLLWLLACLVIKKLIIPETSIRGSKVNIYVVFITQSYLTVPNDIRLNPTLYFIMKIPNKTELQHILYNRSSNIDIKNFMNVYEKCTAKPFFFFSYWFHSDNASHFRKYHLEII